MEEHGFQPHRGKHMDWCDVCDRSRAEHDRQAVRAAQGGDGRGRVVKELPMKFLLIRQQAGEGCDYAIGCGVAADTIEAPSRDAAIAMLREDTVERDGERFGIRWNEDTQVRLAVLVPLANATTLDLDTWRAARDLWRADGEARAAEDRERAEYERLRAKYEGDARSGRLRTEAGQAGRNVAAMATCGPIVVRYR